MHVDTLDGRIDAGFFDRKSAEWRSEQEDCFRCIREHQDANQTYLEEGIKLLELAQKAGEMFRNQSPVEKRRLLDFVLSNSVWMDGMLTATYRHPSDLLAKNVISPPDKNRRDKPGTGNTEKWSRLPGSNQRPAD
jgi:hypothetical protein